MQGFDSLEAEDRLGRWERSGFWAGAASPWTCGRPWTLPTLPSEDFLGEGLAALAKEARTGASADRVACLVEAIGSRLDCLRARERLALSRRSRWDAAGAALAWGAIFSLVLSSAALAASGEDGGGFACLFGVALCYLASGAASVLAAPWRRKRSYVTRP
jgi:hypothetical protein